MTKRTGSMVTIGAAIVLIAAGVALAKSHGDEDGHGHQAQGHDGSHGRSGRHGGEGSEHGTESGSRGEHGGKGGSACDTAASSVIGAFVDSTCPCDGVDDGNGGTVAWKNHGQYVRCVAHAVKAATRAAGVKRRCARDLVPCAARSSCGKRNAVRCIVTATGICTNGACDAPAGMPCTVDSDCTAQVCSVTTATRCAEAGGTAGSGTCCAGSPNGAFLD